MHYGLVKYDVDTSDGRTRRTLPLPAQQGVSEQWQECELAGGWALVWSEHADMLAGAESFPDDPLNTRFFDLSLSERLRLRAAARALGISAQDVADFGGDGNRIAELLLLLAQRRRKPRRDENTGDAVLDGDIQPQARPLPWQPQGGDAWPTTGVIDNFNRADGSLGSNWATPTWVGNGSFAISSNAVHFSSDVSSWGDNYWAQSFPANQEVFATLSANDPAKRGFGFYMRVQGPGVANFDGYEIAHNFGAGDTHYIVRVDNEVETTLGAATTHTTTTGYKYGGSANGTTLTSYVNAGSTWRPLVSRTDSTYNLAGYVGLYALLDVTYFDDFGGGPIGGFWLV